MSNINQRLTRLENATGGRTFSNLSDDELREAVHSLNSRWMRGDEFPRDAERELARLGMVDRDGRRVPLGLSRIVRALGNRDLPGTCYCLSCFPPIESEKSNANDD